MSVCARYDVKNTHPEELRVDLVIKCMRSGDSLYLDGAVDENLIYEIDSFAEVPIKRLYLNSTGGRVKDAFVVARFIRENNIETILRKEAVCMSACTLLFQAGVSRIAHPEALLMYHGVRNPYESTNKKDRLRKCEANPDPECLSEIEAKTKELMELTHQLFDLYKEYGATEELRNHYFSLGKDPQWIDRGNYLQIRDWYMSAQESIAYGVATGLLPSAGLYE